MIERVQPESVNSFLIEHLAQIENEKNVVLKEFYPNLCDNRIDFEQLVGNYILSIEEYIKNSKIPQNENNQVPFVLIGSIVDVQDVYDQTQETIHIVSPFLNQSQVNYTFASYLSPMGRGLLLRKKGDKVAVRLPAGYSQYIINDIRLSC